MKAELSQSSTRAVGDILERAAKALADAGIESARLDAELLMAVASGLERIQVMTGAVEFTQDVLSRYQELVARRAGREPLAYIAGRREFFSLDLEVNPAVLIPRPETEVLVAAALEMMAERPRGAVLDLGTGSGAIAIALAANLPHAQVVATDISERALEMAQRNAKRLGTYDVIEFRQGDCWEAIATSGYRFDLVVSNPPYIEDGELNGLQPEVAKFEPRLALAGGADGLDFYRKICAGVREFLKPGGELMVEIGERQADSVVRLCRLAGCVETAVINDLAGCNRMVRARIA